MKICFVVEDIYPTLNPGVKVLNANGRAVHLKHMGEGLRDIGHEVSYITMDYGQPLVEKTVGFTFYKMYAQDEGIPGLRFILTKVPALMISMKRADADVYIFMCPDPFVGVISWFCKKNNKKFIYYGGSDKDFEKNTWGMNLRDVILFRYGLKNADLVLCQNEYQGRTLKDNYGIDGVTLYNPMGSVERTYDPEGVITWIGNYRKLKRPEMFIKLSQRINDKFVIVGGRARGFSLEQYNKVNSMAENNNIRIMGAIEYEETDKLLSGAKLLVNTSEFEGVSNVFLQAWRRGIPIVSFVDPDNMIRKNDLGIVVKDFEGLVAAVEKLRKGISEEHSKKIKEFFDNTFETGKVVGKFGNYLRSI